uniref:C2H2-type domain-containing protein n=1 Tax=Denticeps clupeoides TaxID=299321 RepID=A0AAY4BGS7_9TELE
MSLDDRPYICTAPGCSQCFQTKEHLRIHRHKHEMSLRFPSTRTENTLSDQTPTPTNFLQKCEEVGLFSELQLSPDDQVCQAAKKMNADRGFWNGTEPLHHAADRRGRCGSRHWRGKPKN